MEAAGENGRFKDLEHESHRGKAHVDTAFMRSSLLAADIESCPVEGHADVFKAALIILESDGQQGELMGQGSLDAGCHPAIIGHATNEHGALQKHS